MASSSQGNYIRLKQDARPSTLHSGNAPLPKEKWEERMSNKKGKEVENSAKGKRKAPAYKLGPIPQGKLEPLDLPSRRCLGKGLSGIIYETEWLGNRYARKDFPLGSMRHNHVYEEEAKPLFDLDHPSIVKCFGYTVGNSSCSLVQEYVDDNLPSMMEKRVEARRKEAQRKKPPQSRVLDIEEIKRLMQGTEEPEGSKAHESNIVAFQLPDAIAIMLQIASAMEYLHDHGVVHGDLKPNNVLLNLESGVMKVKVADFGFIETKKRIKLVSKRARHLEILTWKAPERLEKLLGPVTENANDPFTESDTNSEESESYGNFEESKLALADVYSFGLTCLHILGEELMHPDLSLNQLRKTRTSPGLRHKLPSACPEFLQVLLHSTLEFEFFRRPTFSYIRTLLATFHLSHVPQLSVEGQQTHMKRSSKQKRGKILVRVEKLSDCGGFLPHKSLRKTIHHPTSDPAWKDEISRVKEERGSEWAQCKEKMMDFQEIYQDLKYITQGQFKYPKVYHRNALLELGGPSNGRKQRNTQKVRSPSLFAILKG